MLRLALALIILQCWNISMPIGNLVVLRLEINECEHKMNLTFTIWLHFYVMGHHNQCLIYSCWEIGTGLNHTTSLQYFHAPLVIGGTVKCEIRNQWRWVQDKPLLSDVVGETGRLIVHMETTPCQKVAWANPVCDTQSMVVLLTSPDIVRPALLNMMSRCPNTSWVQIKMIVMLERQKTSRERRQSWVREYCLVREARMEDLWSVVTTMLPLQRMCQWLSWMVQHEWVSISTAWICTEPDPWKGHERWGMIWWKQIVVPSSGHALYLSWAGRTITMEININLSWSRDPQSASPNLQTRDWHNFCKNMHFVWWGDPVYDIQSCVPTE